MIKEFEKLTHEEATLLFKAPAIFSIQALSVYKEINKAQKEDAIKLAHIKTFTEHYMLIPYYEEVDKRFKKDFEEYAAQYFPFNTENCNAIRKEINKVNTIINRLDDEYAMRLSKSLDSYARHVSHAADNVLQNLIFPITFSKL